MPSLADARLAVLVPDMRGDGDSDKPAGPGEVPERCPTWPGRLTVSDVRCVLLCPVDALKMAAPLPA